MRIHIFVRTLNVEGGGSHKNVIAFSRYLLSVGHSVTLHALSVGKNVPPSDVTLVEHAGMTTAFIESHAQLVRLLQTLEQDADVFFLYGVDFIWGGGMYRAKGGEVPVCAYLDTYLESMKAGRSDKAQADPWAWFREWRYFLKRYLWDHIVGMRYARYVDRFIAVSPYVKEVFVRFGFPEAQCAVVPNAFSREALSVLPAQSAQNLVTLLYTGRLTYDKGVDLLLRATAALPPHLLWQLRIVGEGPMKLQIESLIKSLGLAEKVTTLPWMTLEALEREYAQADIFVHPVRWAEPFGRTIVEALAHGIPAIVPSQSGAAWVAGEAGKVFVRTSERSLTEAIETLITDREVRHRLGSKGPIRVQAFRDTVVGAQLEAVFAEVTKQRRV